VLPASCCAIRGWRAQHAVVSRRGQAAVLERQPFAERARRNSLFYANSISGAEAAR